MKNQKSRHEKYSGADSFVFLSGVVQFCCKLFLIKLIRGESGLGEKFFESGAGGDGVGLAVGGRVAYFFPTGFFGTEHRFVGLV